MQTRIPHISRLCSGLVGAVLFTLCTSSAFAGLCITPAENGSWRNSDPNTRGITRVIFDMECRDATRTECDANGICRTVFAVEAHYFLRVYGSCYPTDCHWGRVEGRQIGDWFLFQFNQGFATKYVWVRTYSAWPGWLRVYQQVIYHDGRTNRTTDDWFRR